mgnify:FL=1
MVKSLMAEMNNKRQRRVQRLKRLIVIMLVMVFVIPVTISIVLAVQLHGLGKQVNELQAEIASMQIQLEEQKVDAADSQELTEEEASADVQTLENQNVWSESSRTTPADFGIHKVYLTFDDGPSANTDQILDILDEYGVKATFFVVGKEGYNDQYRRIVEEGHTLGMHSYSHVYRDIYESVEAYGQDLEKLHTYLYELTGVDSRIVRLPGGSSNTVSKDKIQDIIAYLGQQGMTYYDWNVSSGDAASGYVSAQQIADNVLNHVSEHHTSIVLMHDASGKNTTVEALPIILEKILESDNMVLLPITEDTVPIQHVQAQ